MVHSESKLGFLWQMEKEKGIPTILFQTGEAMRLDEQGIKVGLRGVVKVMQHLGMIQSQTKPSPYKSIPVQELFWVRSPGSGLCRLFQKTGSYVRESQELASISDPFGMTQKFTVRAPFSGIIVEQNLLPLMNEGESMVLMAKSEHIPEWGHSGSTKE